MSYVALFCRLALGLLFSWSFVAKAWNPSRFRASVTAFGLLPRRAAAPAAGLVLAAEAAAALGLLAAGPALGAGYGLAAGLLVLFTGVLAAALVRSPGIGCGCFGHDERPVAPADLVRNAGLLALAALGWWSARQAPEEAPALPELATTAVLALAASAFLLLWTRLAEIVELLAPGRGTGRGTAPAAGAPREVSP